MKSTFAAAAMTALAARQVAGHAIFQQLWVDGTDYGTSCVRMPTSNSPITNVGGKDFVCNTGGSRGVAGKCPVAAGSTVTVEMHQQPNDRKCGAEAIGGMHWGPVQGWLAKVTDASKVDPTTAGWFKFHITGWSKNPSGRTGDDDWWGTRDLNNCCGRMDMKIPADLAPGDYLLRAEALALHAAGPSSIGQFYMSCYQLTITGTGTATPATVKIPGVYKDNESGSRANIHAALSDYLPPGGPVYAGGATVAPGGQCKGCASTCKEGTSPTAKAPTSSGGSSGGGTAAVEEAGVEEQGGGGCAQTAYAQCGGNGYTGCTTCQDGFTCKASGEWYSQCVQGS